MKRFSGVRAAASVLIAIPFLFGAQSIAKGGPPPKIKVVALNPDGRSYLPLLNGPPETRSLHSGLVILARGESVGKHSTGSNEEMLVPLDGAGELRFSDHPSVQLKPGLITYAPPYTEHNVVNTGSVPLRYIYITAKAE